MKGRSHRLPSTASHDDWVDGSWTVDCVCGVNFDDGEEMVNCDECGVWVHTRCSRYVKGDELFTCDKCKNRNNRNDSEETEVAQLLVELPTKPVRIESKYASGIPAKRPFRLWAEIPMEDRVHVQGVPGGDPSLFQGISSVFTRELWKSTGYVPKKFNLQYREFPCWDENERMKVKNTDENVNLAKKGASVLFSLSNEKVLAAPMTSLYNSKVCLKDAKRLGTDDRDARRYSGGMKKEKSLLRTVIVHSNKRNKEDSGVSKDRSNKRKMRAEKDVDEWKGGFGACKTVFRPSIDVKESKSHEPGDPESFRNDIQRSKNKNMKDDVFHGSGESNHAVNGCVEQTNNLMAIPCSIEVSASDGSIGVRKKDIEGEQFPVGPRIFHANGDASILEKTDPECSSVKEEVARAAVDAVTSDMKGPVGNAGRPIDKVLTATAEIEAKSVAKHGDAGISQGHVRSHWVKEELGDDYIRGIAGPEVLPPIDAKDPGNKSSTISGTSPKPTDEAPSISAADEDDVNHVEQTSKLKDSSEPKHGSVLPHEPSKSQRSASSTVATHSQKEVLLCFGRSSSSRAAKSSRFDNLKPSDSQKKQKIESSTSSEKDHASKKDHVLSSKVRNKDMNDASRKVFKVHSKHSISSKILHRSQVSHSSISKKTVSDAKDVLRASKTSSAHSITGSGDNDSASLTQSKTSSSAFPPRSEKLNQSSSLPASKDAAQPTHPPVVPSSIATLSDEELALLLHQQLNSSPRVPRVPRVRNAGSLSQSNASAATTSLIKHTSSSGRKDHGLASKRKHKDGSQSSHEMDDKVTKAHKALYSPELRSHDSDKKVGTSTRREENEPLTIVHSAKKNLHPSSTTTTTNSGPCSSNEVNDHNLSSRSSPRDISDDDAGTHRGPTHQTLPGLINEIMSKGKRMTYEELCSAVLPHWPNLRKHNGERYAYSSHSQAVLDCLRNRHEWARLVDRGPKTNSSKKRRKADTEESDDSESVKRRTAEEKHAEAQREDFPRGKRQARKRRRLALQGRGIKDIRKKRKAELTDDEGPFSDSSEDSIFSEDEIHRSGSGHKGGEASGSSEETGTA